MAIPETQQGQSSPQASSFDPSVQALTKAIGTVESGGDYGADDGTGDGAASSGAYQMTPSFLENWAPQAGIQYKSGMTLTPEQQDQIAQNTVHTLGTKGLNGTPLTGQQIISYWNTGNPNAYQDPNYGKNNTYGSTANEVAAAVKDYNNTMGGNSASTAQNAPQSASSGSPSWQDYLMGGGAALLAGLGTAWGYAQKPLTDAAVDAGIGAIAGAPEGGVGAIPGALAGAGTGVVQGIIQDIAGGSSNSNTQQPQTTQTSDTSQQTQTPPPPQATKNPEDAALINDSINSAKQVGSATNEAMQGLQTNRAYAQTNDGKQGIATMGEYGYTPEIGANGEMDYSGAMEKAKQNEGAAANVEGIAAQGSQVPVSEVISQATQSLQGDERMAPEVKKEAIKYATQYAKEYGGKDGTISGEDAIKARKQQYNEVSGANWTKLSSSQIEARKAVGKAFRSASLEHSNNPELQEAAIKEQQKHINAKKVMKRLHQKKAPQTPSTFKTALYKTAARYAEIYIGDKIGGPIGAVLGYVAGEHINRALAKKLSKTKFDTPEMKSALNILNKTNPDMYSRLQKGLEKVGVKIEGKEPDVVKDESMKDVADLKSEPIGEKMRDFDYLVNKGMIKGLVNPNTNGKRISGKSTGFSAHTEKAPPSAELKALMKSGPTPKSKALKALMKGLPMKERKGVMKRI